MTTKKTSKKILKAGIATLLLIMLLSTSVVGQTNQQIKKDSPIATLSDGLPYKGYLRIYIVEPDSRWDMYDGTPYHYAFIDFAYNDMITIDYMDTYTETFTWKGDVQNDNVMVIAALFNPEPQIKHSNPPASNPYEAHYLDAAAGAKPGETDQNVVNEDFTHTVFVEYATANFCQYCPSMGHVLYSIYESHDYPFYYVSLVGDKNDDAYDYLVEKFNLYQYPTEYFDGGAFLFNTIDETFTRSKIETAGLSEVHEVNLSLSVEAIGNGELSIDVSITNLQELHDTEIVKIEELKSKLFGIEATVTNIGNLDATDIEWDILVSPVGDRGFLFNDYVRTYGTVDTLAPDNVIKIRTDKWVFGLAYVKIQVIADRSVLPSYAWVLGPFIIL